jgi:hypothetical protein
MKPSAENHLASPPIGGQDGQDKEVREVAKGAECREHHRPPVKGEVFLLTFLFIEQLTDKEQMNEQCMGCPLRCLSL